MPAKLVTYNSQNYAGTLGSGLVCICVDISGNMQDVWLLSTTKASLLILAPWHPTATTMQVMAMNSILCQ